MYDIVFEYLNPSDGTVHTFTYEQIVNWTVEDGFLFMTNAEGTRIVWNGQYIVNFEVTEVEEEE